MKFARIVCIDNVDLTEEAYARLESLSEAPFVPCYDESPDRNQVHEQIAVADCALVSWRTRVDEKAMVSAPRLRYIGVCASKYTNPKEGNVDLDAARRREITVAAVGQYGDEATAEFIFCALLNLFRGIYSPKWHDMPCELFDKSLGIIGMGAMGRHVLRLAVGFGMKVLYYSRVRKPECEELGARYVTKEELLRSCDIVSLHVPKGTVIMSSQDFTAMKERSVLVNTCLGVVFDPADFQEWIAGPSHFAIMDESCAATYRQFRTTPNVIYPDVVAGRTMESRQRLSAQVLANVEAFLAGQPQNIIN